MSGGVFVLFWIIPTLIYWFIALLLVYHLNLQSNTAGLVGFGCALIAWFALSLIVMKQLITYGPEQ